MNVMASSQLVGVKLAKNQPAESTLSLLNPMTLRPFSSIIEQIAEPTMNKNQMVFTNVSTTII